MASSENKENVAQNFSIEFGAKAWYAVNNTLWSKNSGWPQDDSSFGPNWKLFKNT
jgi:hypothetical protein